MKNNSFTMEAPPIQIDDAMVPPVESASQPEAVAKTAEAINDEPPAKDGMVSFADAFRAASNKEQEAAPQREQQEQAAKESRSSSDFKKIKEERDRANAELDELRNRISGLEASDRSKEIEDIKTERNELSQRLKVAALERHPEFQAAFDVKKEGLIDSAKLLVDEEAAPILEKILKSANPSSKENEGGLEEVLSMLPASKQSRLGAILNRIDELNTERATALKNADQTYQQIIGQEDQRQKERAQETHQVFGNVLKEASNLEIYAERQGDEAWNAEVRERVEAARNIFSGENDAASLARASFWAAAGPKYRELLGKQIELNRMYRRQLDERNGATPGMGSGGKQSAQSGGGDFLSAYMNAQNQSRR